MSNLENIINSFVKTKLSDFQLPENFHDVVIDVYDSDYGKMCHLSFLMKKPFTGEESESIEKVSKNLKKDLKEYFSNTFSGGIQSSCSTLESYLQHKDWYNSKKQK